MKGLSITGLILGIASLVLGWFGIMSLVALPLAIVGLVLSVCNHNCVHGAFDVQYLSWDRHTTPPDV